MLRDSITYIHPQLIAVLIPLILAICLINYLTHSPASHHGTFSTFFGTEGYSEIITNMENEQSVLLIGNNRQGLAYFVEAYVERVEKYESVRLRNPCVFIDLEREIDSQLQQSSHFQVDSLLKRTVWVINLRDAILTHSLLKYISLLREKYFRSRFLIINDEDIVSLKGFKRVYFKKPSQEELRAGILKIQPSLSEVSVTNLVWYYQNRVDKIAEIVERGEVDTFHLREKALQSQYIHMREEHQSLLRVICERGEMEKGQRMIIDNHNILVGVDGGYYRWRSEEALLIYSMSSQKKCVIPKSYSYYNKGQHLRELIVGLERKLRVDIQQKGKVAKGKDSKRDNGLKKRVKKRQKVARVDSNQSSTVIDSNNSDVLALELVINSSRRIKLSKPNQNVSKSHPKYQYVNTKKQRKNSTKPLKRPIKTQEIAIL